MWPFRRVQKPPAPRLVDLDQRLCDVEKSIDWLKKGDKELNARISAVMRRQAVAQDAPQATIEAAPALPPLPSLAELQGRWRQRRGLG
jgi:hypothetical protein